MRVRSACAAAALIAHTFAPPANAQDLSAYPNREIRSVCNFAAGSGADVLVRFYSDRLAKLTGNPVIVDNRPGAQGSLATEFVAKSKPDGYTIHITPASSTLATAPHIFRQLNFDPARDFAPVATLAKLSFGIAVDAKSPHRTLPELTAYLRTKPGHGSYGTGSNSGQVTGELYKVGTGLTTTYVPYKVTGQALVDLVGGQTDFITYDSTFMVTHHRSGRIRILAVSSAARNAALPEVPAMAELGFSGFDVTPWWGVVVPAGTPKPIIDKLSQWFFEITAQAETKAFLSNLATDVFPGDAESMAKLLKEDLERWGRYVRLANIEKQ